MIIMEKELTELEKYQKEMERIRKIRVQALAILRRAKDAGIPESEMRIDAVHLKPYLDPNYHNGNKGMEVNQLCNHIFNEANHLFDYDFIIIDGGDMFARRKAGFALLFRMIACDRGGKFYTCQDVSHKLQTINSTVEINRNDLTDELKTYDVLFMEEFRKEQLKTGFEIQWFMDEILTTRQLEGKPTIFTFSNPVAGNEHSQQNALTSTTAYGQYMCMLSQTDMEGMRVPRTLRIRVACNNG